MSDKEFNGLSDKDKGRVIEAKLVDMIVKPALDRATSNMKKAHSDMSAAFKGEEKK
jgi:hypothetical protein